MDQGRYGASQVNYVTKSGTNQFHGNLYEIWNGSVLNAADYFTNATPGNHKPRSTVNHFGGSLGGPILHDKLFFFFDTEWVRIALPIVTPATVPTPAFQQYVLQQLPLGGTDSVTGSQYPPAPQLGAVLPQDVLALRQYRGTPLAILGCPFEPAEPGRGNPPNGNGCANRQSVSHSSDDHEQVQTVRIDYNIDAENTAWFRFQSDTGLQAAYTDPINPVIQRYFPAAALLFRRWIHPRLLAESGQLLQSRVLLVREPVRPRRFSEDARRVSDRPAGQRRQRAFTTLGGLDNTWLQGRRATRVLHQ